MPNYVRKALHRFQHILMGDKEYSPHICATIQYGQKIQYSDPLDASEYLSDKKPHSTILWKLLVLCNCYQQKYSPSP